ncbi:OsmC family protein [uncultured Methanospirillum sp.]|uniref:OsmC family protein n=1 Tax=uncultured Methanospirillum sp. TaxID=262503 RepID=UPI0029C8AE31|nr:OsmC family protein [uncultured Methanospirillum sp.]
MANSSGPNEYARGWNGEVTMSSVKNSEPHTCAPPVGLPPMEIHATWDKEAGTLVATTRANCNIAMAATDELMSTGKIPGPMDTFISALAGCLVHEIIDVMINTDKIDVKDINVSVHGVRRPTPPTLFDTLHVTLTLTGKIDNDYAEKVIRDIMTRKCPVAATFGRASYLTWEHIILTSRI